MFRLPRKYARSRSIRRKNFVRLRGRRWFRITYFSCMSVLVSILVLVIANLFKQIQIIGKKSIEFLIYKNEGKAVFFNWNQMKSHCLQSFLPKNIISELISAPKWIWILIVLVWIMAMWNLIIKRWYNWFTLYADRTNNVNHFASFYEIDSTYELIPDRNKFYKSVPGQPVAHIHGLNGRIMIFHPLLWVKQLLKTPLGLTKEVFPKWYQELRPKLKDKFPKQFKDQFNVDGGFNGFYWIDTAATHAKTTGATRSGKDQMRGYPLIDIIRRSNKPWNIIDTDAKNEDFKMSYRALRKAGFDVLALNIMDVDHSETFNPFQLALDYAMDGDLDHAKIEVAKVVQIIGSDSNSKGSGDVWDKTAESTQQSVILILLLLAMEQNDPTLATPAGVPQFINSLNQFSDEKVDGFTKYLQMLGKRERTPLVNEIMLTAGAYLGSSGDTKTSVMFTLQARSRLFASETVARLTSGNSLKVMDMAYPRMLKIKLSEQYSQNIADIRLYNQDSKNENDFIEEDKVSISRSGVLQYPFKEKFPKEWSIVVSFNETNNPHHVRNDEIVIAGHKEQKRKLGGKILVDKYTKQPIEKVVTEHIDQKIYYGEASISLRYSERPKAVFIITPQDNDNYASIATLFISQVFAVTTSVASDITRRKLTNPIFYKLNEFSMFPRIPGFNNLLTRGLTYGHIVEIYLQSIAQLSLQYSKEEVQEINDNTLNWFHILTPNSETNKEFSNALGTVKVLKESVNSQVGLDHDERGNRQMNEVDVPLLDPVEIQNLVNNEMITLPLAKRLDKKFRKIKSVPIFATGPYRLPNARDLLKKEFSLEYFTSELDIKGKTVQFTYEYLFKDFSPYYLALEQETKEESEDSMPKFEIKDNLSEVESVLDGVLESTQSDTDDLTNIEDQVNQLKKNSNMTILSKNDSSENIKLANEALVEAARLLNISTISSSWQSVLDGRYMVNNPTIKEINNDLSLSWRAVWTVSQVVNENINLNQMESFLLEDDIDDEEY